MVAVYVDERDPLAREVVPKLATNRDVLVLRRLAIAALLEPTPKLRERLAERRQLGPGLLGLHFAPP
jgi:hypothetical protein